LRTAIEQLAHLASSRNAGRARSSQLLACGFTEGHDVVEALKLAAEEEAGGQLIECGLQE